MVDEYPPDEGHETSPSAWTADDPRATVGGMTSGVPALSGAAWHRIPADDQASGAARRYVAAWLNDRDAEPHDIDDLSLAASELAANVVQHGDATQVYVRLADVDPRCWTLEVAGGRNALPAALTDPTAWVISRPDSANGRGLGIVRAVVDEIEVLADDDGLAIRCHRLRT
jgi:anti-sigma regulatory factor (Ser/Thr protein kinase)